MYMEAFSAFALSAPEIHDKFPSGLLFISFLRYVDIYCGVRIQYVCQYFDWMHASIEKWGDVYLQNDFL